MITTIETHHGLTGDRYTVEADALGIRIEHEVIDGNGHAELAGMATLMIVPEAAAQVVMALRRAQMEVGA